MASGEAVSQGPDAPETSLARSVASESLLDLGGLTADVLIDLTTDSEVLDAVPIVASLRKVYRAGRDVRNQLYIRKVVRFLSPIAHTAAEDRECFVRRLEQRDELFRFGETVLLLLERADDMRKPEIIGRIVAAHVSGLLPYEKAMRAAAIVDRAYVKDLEFLASFVEGPQGANTPIAESLTAAGVLSQGGFDGGTVGGDDGGVIYVLNEYGRIIMQFGLRLSPLGVPPKNQGPNGFVMRVARKHEGR